VKTPVDKKTQIRQRAEQDLEAFIRLIHPQRVLGGIHRELIQWWTREDASTHQLVLLPRDHGKSAMVAYRVAWEITRNPAVRVLYVSSTALLATKQLKFIKDILTSDVYRFYWPEMVNQEESKREKWSESEISIDHPLRKQEIIRDPTVFTAGLTTSITGLHFDISVLDDIVVKENAYTEEGRDKVETQYSLLASIEATDAMQWVVGTRYHPKDLYQQLISMEVEQFDKEHTVVGTLPLYEVMERQVENRGDGSGEFLWPRQQRYDGKWFGFDQDILAKKRAQYLDRLQYRAQYYNDPNDPDEAGINREYFQYFEREQVKRFEGKWSYNGKRLNIFAAIDFAWSLARRSDYTSIVVVGVNSDQQYYILDIDRFKTDKIGDYFQHILNLHAKWDFRKLRAEVTVAQEVIVKDLKENYIRNYGLSLEVEDSRPSRNEGTKEERIYATLQPRYQNRQIFHYMGGNCQVLEEELVLQKPPHDDIKDALTSAIQAAVPPSTAHQQFRKTYKDMAARSGASRFGGIL
jgi:phage terminase large subunit-like protein